MRAFSARLSGIVPPFPRGQALGVAIGVALAAFAVLAGYHESYRGRIFPGLSVDGQPVGGMTVGQARELLGRQLRDSLEAPLVVEAKGQRWELSRQRLGVTASPDQVVSSAFEVGRDGPVSDRLLTPILLRFRPKDLQSGVQLAPVDWAVVLGPIARSVDRAAVDARLRLTADRQVELLPDHAGARLDIAASGRAISQALASRSHEPVELTVRTVPPGVRAGDLGPAQQQAELALSGPVSLVDGGREWELSTTEIGRALRLPGDSAGASGNQLRLDPARIDAFVQQVAAQIDRPPRDARLVLGPTGVVIESSLTGRTVDRPDTATRVRAAIFSPNRRLAPIVTETAPKVSNGDLAQAQAVANRLISAPITLRAADGRTWTLTTAALRRMLSLQPPAPPGQSATATTPAPSLDAGQLKAYVASLAQEIDRPAFNARFLYNGGQPRLLRDAVVGQELDRQSTVARIETAATGPNRTVDLPITPLAPAFTAEDAPKLAGLQLIAESSTSYAGSIPPRRHNVELATSLLNGVVVAPGQVFSFNREVGPQTLDRGFQVGYGIVAEGNGAVKTVPSVAGGICQVSTTLFQPIFWAGYEIEERHWHAYWIAHYVSHGYPGLDDTVDDASGLDFQFKNDTPNPLLIQSATDGERVHFAIYGVPPTWTVRVDPPVITAVIKTDRTLRVEVDPTLRPGQRIYTEAAEDGFTVVVRRVVNEANGKVRELVLRSVYAPSHNVVVVGPGTA